MVFWVREDIKLEKESENISTDLDEALRTQVKDEDTFDFDAQDIDDDVSNEIKYEFKQEDNSDNELLSVIKGFKIQSVVEDEECGRYTYC